MSARLHPSHDIVIGVWLGNAFSDGDDHNQLPADSDVLGCGVDRGTDEIGGRVGDQLIETVNVVRRKPDHRPLVVDPDDDPAAFAVGKCHKVAGERFWTCDVLLELMTAVFAASDHFNELYCFHNW